MEYQDYKEAVKRTLPKLGDWHGNPVILDSMHCLMGDFSEYYELDAAIVKEDSVNVGEEITDKLWYMSNYCNVRSIDVSQVAFFKIDHDLPRNALSQRIESLNKEINLALSELQNYDKKEWVYQKPETQKVKDRRAELAVAVLVYLNILYSYNELDPGRCMQNNIDKLIKRFPLDQGFTTEAANNRNLEAERKQLEN